MFEKYRINNLNKYRVDVRVTDGDDVNRRWVMDIVTNEDTNFVIRGGPQCLFYIGKIISIVEEMEQESKE